MAALEKAARDREQVESFKRKQVREREKEKESGNGRIDNGPWGSVEMPEP